MSQEYEYKHVECNPKEYKNTLYNLTNSGWVEDSKPYFFTRVKDEVKVKRVSFLLKRKIKL